MNAARPPRILIVDDQYGRVVVDGRNEDRARLCTSLQIRDVSPAEDGGGRGPGVRDQHLVAEAVFLRGQLPKVARVGDVVENDLPGVLNAIATQADGNSKRQGLALVVLDLCFYTGRVTAPANAKLPGMAEGRTGDMDPSNYFGLQLLAAIRREYPHLPVVVLSSQNRAEVSESYSTLGATAFIERDHADGAEVLKDLIQRHGLIEDATGRVVGWSVSIRRALREARVSAKIGTNLLIRGEPGTGKELMAEYAHRCRFANELGASGQPIAPLIVVNGAALHPDQWQSTLFGHLAGSFTGAKTARTGDLKRANGGDIFVDEIGDLMPLVQAGLLRTLQDGSYTPLGSNTPQHVNARFITATNRHMEEMVALGTYRSDLLDRLRAGGCVWLPPLRQRIEDLPPLVEFLLREAEQEQAATRRVVHASALERLGSYDWPGNIRELKSVIARAVARHPDVEYLTAAQLELDAGQKPSVTGDSETPRSGLAQDLRADVAGSPEFSLAELLRAIDAFNPREIPTGDVRGALPKLHTAYGHLVALCLRTAAEFVRSHSINNPVDEARITPVMRFLTGDAKLSSVKAADTLKRIGRLAPEVKIALDCEPEAKELRVRALITRPEAGGGSGRDKNNKSGA